MGPSRLPGMEILPAIDLLDGACVRLHQGDYDQVTRFSDDPVAQAWIGSRRGQHGCTWWISMAPSADCP